MNAPTRILILAFVIVAALGSFWAHWLRKRRAGAKDEDTCIACGYPTRGLPGTICPECGGDLSKPGAVLRAGQIPPVKPLALAMTILALVIPLAVASAPLGAMLFSGVDRYERYDAVPASGKFKDISIIQSGKGWPQPRVGIIKIILTTNANFAMVIHIDPDTLDCQYPGPDWKPIHGPLDSDKILSAMKTAGIDTTDPKVIAEAGSLVRFSRQIAQRQWLSSEPTWTNWVPTITVRRYTPMPSYVVHGLIWLMLGAIAFVIVRRRQRGAGA